MKSHLSNFFSWFGIVGGAITLFSNLETIIKFSDWARYIVSHWREWITIFWKWIFSWIHIDINPSVIPPLTFLLFYLMIAVGLWVRKPRKPSAAQSRNYMHYIQIMVLWILFTVKSPGGDVYVLLLPALLCGACLYLVTLFVTEDELAKKIWYILTGFTILYGLNLLSFLSLDLKVPPA